MRFDTPADGDRNTATHPAREVTELLEVLWNRGRDLTSPAPVSSSQLRVLYVLDRDEPVNLRTLGDVLGSAPSSVSRMCDRLDALGYIERSPGSASRREVEVRLSARGRSHLDDLRARREAALLDVVGAMAPAVRAALTAGLGGFRRAVEDLGGPGGPGGSFADAGDPGDAGEDADVGDVGDGGGVPGSAAGCVRWRDPRSSRRSAGGTPGLPDACPGRTRERS
ncbi:MarR family winged helix-turn-helix transcriptional regulator [Streptomyces lavendofoliae]|uniref:MarR family winged helix-turn-helix transcriptional regulator n=1 Tax=Streptomyces lavendofoliae TaxID=67314 RepID=UPI003D947120